MALRRSPPPEEVPPAEVPLVNAGDDEDNEIRFNQNQNQNIVEIHDFTNTRRHPQYNQMTEHAKEYDDYRVSKARSFPGYLSWITRSVGDLRTQIDLFTNDANEDQLSTLDEVRKKVRFRCDNASNFVEEIENDTQIVCTTMWERLKSEAYFQAADKTIADANKKTASWKQAQKYLATEARKLESWRKFAKGRCVEMWTRRSNRRL